jgi:predicted Zn-dependent protease
LHLALKIIRRAVDLNPANPVLLHDLGTFLVQAQHDQEAAESFQAAIVAAPDFAKAYASFAAIRAPRVARASCRLQREAVRRVPVRNDFKASWQRMRR